MNEMWDKLKDADFLRPNVGCIIGLEAIEYREGHTFIMKDGKTIPISRKLFQTMRESYRLWLIKQ